MGASLLNCDSVSADERTTWWKEVKSRRSQYLVAIPDHVRASLKAKDADFVPFPFESCMSPVGKSSKAAPLQGDFNCDGKPDFAISGIPGNEPFAAAFASTETPSSDEWELLRQQEMEWSWKKPAVVYIGLSDGAGFAWVSVSGTCASKRGVLNEELLRSAREDILEYRAKEVGPAGFDFDWISKKRCEVLTIGCCDGPGMDYLWNQRTKKLVKTYLGEC